MPQIKPAQIEEPETCDGWVYEKEEDGDESQTTSAAAGLLLAPLNIQVLFWWGVKLLWNAAVRRLEGWEKT